MEWQYFWSLCGRLVLALVLAAAIGLEREISGRPAGLRTHMLIMLGVVCFCEAGKAVGGDPGRVASQVVTGIGFLGAGTILRLGPEVKGLTTAASVWATAAIGMSVTIGGPFLVFGIVATITSVAVLLLLNRLEVRYFPHIHGRTMRVEVVSDADVGAVVEALSARKIAIRELERTVSSGRIELHLRLSGNVDDAPNQLTLLPSVLSASWTR